MSLIAATPAIAADDPLLRPIEPEYSKRFLTPAQPARIFGNTSLVGFGALSVAVIRTHAGLILIDGALPQGVGDVEAHLRALGMDIRDVRYILSTEPHFDHASGLAALERDSGAVVLAGAAAVRTLRAGGIDPTDPQAPDLAPSPPPTSSARCAMERSSVWATSRSQPSPCPATPRIDGVELDDMRRQTLRPRGLCRQHQRGRAQELPLFRPRASRSGGQFPGSIARLRALPCDIIITSHPDNSDGDKKLAAFLRNPSPNPWLERDGCRKAADGYEQRLNARLAQEARR
jgi:metallo-beta-lactamase class B